MSVCLAFLQNPETYKEIKVYKNITLSLLVSSCLLISACAKDMKQSDRLSMQGCFVGGIGAGTIAYLANLGDKDAKDVAFIAGMMGCIAGSIAGHHIGRKAEEYSNAQTAAEEEIAFNKKSAKELKKYNSTLATNIKDYNKQIDAIKNSELSQKERQKNLKKTRDIVIAQRNKAKESLANTETELSKSRKIYAQFSEQAPKEDTGDWQTQIASLEQEKQILAEHVSTLNALDASI